VVVVNYREQPVGPLVFLTLFVIVCLIGMPIWALVHFGVPHSIFAGKLVMAPMLGGLFVIMIARTFSFNARVRRDPRALQWDGASLSLWQGDRVETVPWRHVLRVWITQGRKASDVSFLKIATNKAGGGLMRWSFPSRRLQLSGQSLTDLASQLEQARAGTPVTPASKSAEREEAAQRYEERLSIARGIVAIVMSVYFITLVGMIVHLSSNTMLLTPHDPLLWFSAKCAFLSVFAAWMISYVKTVRDKARADWRVAASLLRQVLFVAVSSGAMMGVWAWLAANVYVTDKTWGGHVEHGAVLMRINEPWITHRGHVNVEAHLIDRPGRDVFFAVDDSDGELLKHWHDPGYIDEPACITVPVQWAGYAIRSEVTTDTLLPKGSVSTCK
jgi:hypothetical protein